MNQTKSKRVNHTTKVNEYSDHVTIDTPDFKVIWELFSYSKGQKPRIYTALLLLSLASFCVMYSAKILGSVVESIANQSIGSKGWQLAGLFLALEFLYIILLYFGRLVFAKATTEIVLNIRKALFLKTTKLPIRYFDITPIGRTITRLTVDVESLENFFSKTLSTIVSTSIQVVGIIIAIVITKPDFGWIIFSACIPALLFTLLIKNRQRTLLRNTKLSRAACNSNLAENITGLEVIRIFNLESWSLGRFTDLSKVNYQDHISLMNFNSLTRGMIVFLCALPVLGVLYFGALEVLAGSMSLAIFVAFIRYTERFMSPIRQLSNEIQVIQDSLSSAERIRQMLREPEEKRVHSPNSAYSELGNQPTDTKSNAKSKIKSTVKKGRTIAGAIAFENVNMAYNKHNLVLQDINLRIDPGTTIGLVGESGSGKTTFSNLIPMLYPILSGRILIDGKDIEDFDTETLRRNIGIVNQNVEIIRGTIRENLLHGTPDELHGNHEFIDRITEISGLKKLTDLYHHGLNTKVVERGSNLSMGEKQLIAITRVMIRDPKIIILDEATANIDEQSELIIKSAFETLFKNRTVIIIAHRLKTVINCDRIFVFRDGKIVETGSHQELVESAGYYSKLAAHQGLN